MSSVYEKFIAANHALFTCQQSVTTEQWNEMDSEAQSQVCKSESEAVATFLKNDSVSFKHLINERLAALNHH
jgi:hypothetical protein